MTPSLSLEESYFEWLLDQVEAQRGSQTYRELCWALFQTEFVGIIPHDDNRVEDGHQLMVEFFNATENLEVKQIGHEGGCSFLELIVGLSRRLEFVAGGEARIWAWTLLGNLGFHSASDPLNRHTHAYIREACDRVINRTYDEDGNGGLFPLAYPEHDQREVELWYQMNAYVEENLDPHEMV